MRNQELGISDQGSGYREQETGNGELKTGIWELRTENWKLENGSNIFLMQPIYVWPVLRLYFLVSFYMINITMTITIKYIYFLLNSK